MILELMEVYDAKDMSKVMFCDLKHEIENKK